jgi:hypothetical protein
VVDQYLGQSLNGAYLNGKALLLLSQYIKPKKGHGMK